MRTNTIKGVSTALAVCFFISCTQLSESNVSLKEYNDLLGQTILLLPDSVMTKEQFELKIKLLDLCYRHIYIEDNCQKLPIGKEHFEKEGIPAFYHDVIQYQIKETNECIKKWAAEGDIPAECLNQDSLFNETKERYWKIERPLMVKEMESK